MRAWVLFFVGIVLFVPSARAGPKKPVDMAAVLKLAAQGDKLFAQRKYSDALRLYEQADGLSHHTCFVCEMDVLQVDETFGNLSDAVKEAGRALKAAGTNSASAAQAYLIRGVLLARLADSERDKKLKQAETDLRQALKLNPEEAMAKYDLGFVLLRMKRDAEGITELKAYLADPRANPRTEADARRLIANPERAREPFVPDFSVTTLEGQTVSNTSLEGKVILFDFWGTWCPPCRSAVPMLLDLRKKYAGKPVEIVGISSDTNEQAWKQFIAKHHMDWPEYIDLSQRLQTLFQVRDFPTFIVADSQGIIRLRRSGYGQLTEAWLEDAINKALRHHPPG